jgi:hypothetical protein
MVKYGDEFDDLVECAATSSAKKLVVATAPATIELDTQTPPAYDMGAAMVEQGRNVKYDGSV